MTDINSLKTDEIEKIVEKQRENKKSLSKGLNFTPLNPIDKFTSIDELLREDIIAQRENTIANRELANITHKLLLILIGKDGTGASIQPNGVDTSGILESITRGDDYRTLNKVIHNDTGDKTILKIEGSGLIDVIKFVSSNASVVNKDYSIRIRCNDTILYENTWAELEARSPNERGMIAFEDAVINNEYLIIIKTIMYSESFMIEVYDSNATFSLIQVKYHERV